MTVTILALKALSCGHCVKSVTRVLEQIDGVEQVQVTLNFAKVIGDVSAQTLIDAIVEAGYGAELTQPTFELTLSGLNCGHCIKSTEKALSAVENMDVFDVTKTSAKIYGSADPQAVIAAITAAGFEAHLINEIPKSELPTRLVTEPTSGSVEPELTANENSISLLLEGLTCAACVLKVERALQGVDGVKSVNVNLAEQTAFVTGEVNPQELINRVMQAGYGAEIIEDDNVRREKQQAQTQGEIRRRQWQSIMALVVGFGLMLWGLVGGQMQVTEANQLNWLVVGLVTLAVILLTGGHFYQRAIKNLLNKTATMDTLVALGTGSAWLFSMVVVLKPEFFPDNARHLYFESSAMIIGLINVGKMLEVKARQRSSKALEQLLDLTPKTAKVVDEQGTHEIPLNQVQQGMRLRLQTGDRVSVDGVVVEGSVWVDESMLTGEPLSVQKNQGDNVTAGTVVTDGAALFQATQIGNQTMLANIIKLVRRAQSSKPKLGQLADKIAAVFVPIVLAIALIAALIWYVITQDLSYSFIVLTTVLIIACPCALGLATPMSIIAGVGRAAELGVLVRDADALQKAASANTIVFDKTGTLTKGEPKVTALYTFGEMTQESAVHFAASLEQGASHPLAKAILALNEKQIEKVTAFRTLKGLGVTGMIQGKNIALGNRTLMTQLGVSLDLAEQLFQQESEKGATVVFLSVENQLGAIFVIRDPLREDSVSALQRLASQGYQLVMLTGDQEKTAQAIAAELGIHHVIAGVLPDGKAQAIQQLQAQGRKVVMVGDGINDAPALAQADVSIAMGSGNDIAIETADLTLMRHSMLAVVDALALSKGTLRNMKQNLFFAFVYNSLGIPLAAGLFYPLFGWLLNPMIGGAAMAFSSITVASNANRLLKFVPKK